MGYTIFKNNGQPALSDTVLNNMQVELMKLVFPIGSTYITQENTNPGEILKFGTWERLKGKVCLGLDEEDSDLNEIGKTGGEKTHTLTESEMPTHSHSMVFSAVGAGSGKGIPWSSSTNIYGEDPACCQPKGGSQAHNNMQPFEVVGYMWIRRT